MADFCPLTQEVYSWPTLLAVQGGSCQIHKNQLRKKKKRIEKLGISIRKRIR